MNPRALIVPFLTSAIALFGGRAYAYEWSRIKVPGSDWTLEVPRGGDAHLSEVGVRRAKINDHGSITHRGLHLFDPKKVVGTRTEGVIIHYALDALDNTMRATFAQTHGEPRFVPPKKYAIGSFVATETGWRLQHQGVDQVVMLYEIPVSKREVIFLEYTSPQSRFDDYATVYTRMRDSLKPPSKKKRG